MDHRNRGKANPRFQRGQAQESQVNNGDVDSASQAIRISLVIPPQMAPGLNKMERQPFLADDGHMYNDGRPDFSRNTRQNLSGNFRQDQYEGSRQDPYGGFRRDPYEGLSRERRDSRDSFNRNSRPDFPEFRNGPRELMENPFGYRRQDFPRDSRQYSSEQRFDSFRDHRPEPLMGGGNRLQRPAHDRGPPHVAPYDNHPYCDQVARDNRHPPLLSSSNPARNPMGIQRPVSNMHYNDVSVQQQRHIRDREHSGSYDNRPYYDQMDRFERPPSYEDHGYQHTEPYNNHPYHDQMGGVERPPPYESVIYARSETSPYRSLDRQGEFDNTRGLYFDIGEEGRREPVSGRGSGRGRGDGKGRGEGRGRGEGSGRGRGEGRGRGDGRGRGEGRGRGDGRGRGEGRSRGDGRGRGIARGRGTGRKSSEVGSEQDVDAGDTGRSSSVDSSVSESCVNPENVKNQSKKSMHVKTKAEAKKADAKPTATSTQDNAVGIEGGELSGTKASITIKAPLEQPTQVTEMLVKHFKVKGEKTQLTIHGESIVLSSKQCICFVTVSANSKQQEKRLIKNMCHSIAQELKTACMYSISCWKKNSEEKSKKCSDHAETVSTQKSDTSSVASESTNEVSLTEQDKPENKSAKKSKKSEKQKKSSSLSKIVITITKGFSSTAKLVSFLHESVGELREIISGEPATHNLLEELAVCEYIVANKADAEKVSQALNEIEGVKASCCIMNNPTNNQGPAKPKDMKKLIQETVEQIDQKAQKELAKHSNKVCEAGKALLRSQELASSSTADTDDIQELYAILDKLRELDNQKKEFETRIKKLKTILNQLVPGPDSQKDVDNILRDVGIECNRLSAGLPMYARRKDVVDKVSSNQVSIILGETGSGKSTQLAQYLLEEGVVKDGSIVCTQPRKVAAITLAERVSKELVRKVGTLVGYKSGAKQRFRQDTKIWFYTDHTLLNECLKDPLLSKYSCIIIDEAHERSIYTDILLGMIKSFLPQRPDLKLVITSATINPEIFIKYFSSSPELRVSGRAFPVDIIYEDPDKSTPFENYEEKAISKVVEIHKKEGKGDILVFLTSSVEIMRCCEELPKRLTGKTDYACFPLHGQLPPEEQRKAFEPLEEGKRKIVFSTNCAETSVTIDGIKFVVDTGVVNEMRYDPRKNMSSLGTQIISQSSANQRKGRAGRTASGTCYRLYTEESFDAMATINKPEILRVHLGQAVLKLAELGVDVRKYDFVESPEQEAIDSAINVLHELKALTVENAAITDVGKWLAKLPFDPRQSYLIYHGYKNGLLYDAVTLAILVGNGSNLIYRGLNESEEQVSARTKSDFGSLSGDLFMWLKIYKEWVGMEKKEQVSWCKEHCINYKVLSLTRQTIAEVRQTLTKELNATFQFDFSDDDDSLNLLRELVFYAYLPSLCYYSGHKRGGYFSASTGHQVHPHPSSNLAAQNYYPEWIVYTQLTKTSRDFIRGITMVEESLIENAITSGMLKHDILSMKKHKIDVVYHEEVGQTVFRQLVGPQFSKLRAVEEDLALAGMSSVVVEAERELGIFEVHSSTPMLSSKKAVMKSIINETTTNLRLDNAEFSLGEKECGVRAVLGEGGCVTAILMPNESNKVCISAEDSNTTEEEVCATFSLFGRILECKRFKKSASWGFVRYGSFQEAKNAVEVSCNHTNLKGSLMVNVTKQKRSGFEARLSWCRRPIKGKGLAIIRCPPLERSSLVGRIICVDGKPLEVEVSKKNESEFVVFNTGQSEETDVKAALLNELDHEENLEKQLQVNVVREQVDLCLKNFQMFKRCLTQAFAEQVPEEKFSLQFVNPKKGSVNYVAFISFDSAIDGFQACDTLRKMRFCFGGREVKISPYLKTKISIPKAIMKVCDSKFNMLQQIVDDDSDIDVTINFRKLPQGDTIAEILSADKESMVRVRDTLQKELEGDIIDCGLNSLVRCLLRKKGLEFLRKIETDIDGVMLRPCTRTEKVHIYGSTKAVTMAKSQIDSYLGKLSQGVQETICLTGPGRPAGLMKVLMQQYPDLRDDFANKFGVEDVTIDYKRQKLSVIGSKESVSKVKEAIDTIQQNMPAVNRARDSDKDLPDCVTCMCPVDDKEDLYRLEQCGHSFCLTCLRMQLQVQVDDKQFPLLCARETCQRPWVWKDILMCVRKGWVSNKKLVERAMDAFVTASSGQYKYCLSPNCPVAYEVTDVKEGCEFTCPSCQVSLCSSCHTAYHADLTCREAASVASADLIMEGWKKKNAERCKACPRCEALIEKSEGCNKMHCKCGAYFCWLCLADFEDEQKCYAHLAKIHGGFS